MRDRGPEGAGSIHCGKQGVARESWLTWNNTTFSDRWSHKRPRLIPPLFCERVRLSAGLIREKLESRSSTQAETRYGFYAARVRRSSASFETTIPII